MSFQVALRYSTCLLSFALIQQFAESLYVRIVIQRKFGKWPQDFFTVFVVLNLVAFLFLAFFAVNSTATLMILLSGFVLQGIFRAQWWGDFNGASDSMTSLVLLSLIGLYLWPDSFWLKTFFLYFLTAEILLSYFVSGLQKLLKGHWLSGRSLTEISICSEYIIPNWFVRAVRIPRFAQLISLAVISFEILSPGIILAPQLLDIFIGVALIFHLSVYLIFGLNRFFLTWSAGLPILYFVISSR